MVLWKLKVPCKVKTFRWRVLSGLLPTMFNLMLKTVVVDSRSTLCGSPGESVLHALFTCEHASDV